MLLKHNCYEYKSHVYLSVSNNFAVVYIPQYFAVHFSLNKVPARTTLSVDFTAMRRLFGVKFTAVDTACRGLLIL